MLRTDDTEELHMLRISAVYGDLLIKPKNLALILKVQQAIGCS